MLKHVKFRCSYCKPKDEQKFYTPNELRSHMINDCFEFHDYYSSMNISAPDDKDSARGSNFRPDYYDEISYLDEVDDLMKELGCNINFKPKKKSLD